MAAGKPALRIMLRQPARSESAPGQGKGQSRRFAHIMRGRIGKLVVSLFFSFFLWKTRARCQPSVGADDGDEGCAEAFDGREALPQSLRAARQLRVEEVLAADQHLPPRVRTHDTRGP